MGVFFVAIKKTRIEGGEVANEQNLIPYGKGNQSESEEREMRSRGGKRSGETRRRTAALRDTMNRLLTMKVEVDGLSEVIRSDGGDRTWTRMF